VSLLLGASSAAAQGNRPRACIANNEQAQELEKKGKLLAARARARACSAGCPGDLARDCVAIAARLDQDIPTVTFGARLDKRDQFNVKILVDGVAVATAIDGRVVEVDPGPHRIGWQFADGTRLEQSVVISQGEKNRLIVGEAVAGAGSDGEPSGQAAGGINPPPTLAWVFAGVSVASLGTFGVLGGLALSERSDLDACIESRTCNPDDVSSVETKALVADVMLGVGAATLVGAALAWVFWPADEQPALRAGFVIAPQPGGAVFGLAGAF
jgi:hypothetical protein